MIIPKHCQTLFIFTLMLIPIFSCSKKNSTSPGDTQTSEFIRCTVNGTSMNWTTCKYEIDVDDNQVGIYNDGRNEYIEIVLLSSGGNIPLGTYNQNNRVFSMEYYPGNDGYDIIINVSVTITKYDLTNKIIEGSFSATLQNNGGQTVNITNGSFRANED